MLEGSFPPPSLSLPPSPPVSGSLFSLSPSCALFPSSPMPSLPSEHPDSSHRATLPAPPLCSPCQAGKSPGPDCIPLGPTQSQPRSPLLQQVGTQSGREIIQTGSRKEKTDAGEREREGGRFYITGSPGLNRSEDSASPQRSALPPATLASSPSFTR